MKGKLWFAIYLSPAIGVGIVVGIVTSSFIGFSVGSLATMLVLLRSRRNRWADYIIDKSP